jgi:Subtilase family
VRLAIRHRARVVRRGGALSAVVATLALAVAAPAGAQDDGSEGNGPPRWEAGRALIKVDMDAVGGQDPNARLRDFVLEVGRGARLTGRLPLVKDVFEIQTPGASLTDDLDRLANADQRAHRQPWLLWVQPDYIASPRPNANLNQTEYWPKDPLFWWRRWPNPGGCAGREQGTIGQVGSWPLRADLRDKDGVWAPFDPTPQSTRDDRPRTGLTRALSSIDVLPVWNALGHATEGRTDGGEWGDDDLRRSAIAVWDTGIGSHPDVAPQVAATVSVGTPRAEDRDTQDDADELVLATTDNKHRFDGHLLEQLAESPDGNPYNRPGIRASVHRPRRSLTALDDVGSLGSQTTAPTGCDGHGTQVASVAAATAGNGLGLAGVGWDVPLVSVRPHRPWDTLVPPEQPVSETLEGERAQGPVDLTDENLVQQLAAIRALRLPIVNMSFGMRLFSKRLIKRGDGPGTATTIVTRPVVAEALARAFAGDNVLGVTSAGPGRYGTGRTYHHAELDAGAADAVQAPCGLSYLASSGAVELGGKLRQFAVPGVDLRRLNLLCVTASTSESVELPSASGAGDAAVDLTAPGYDVPVATRPTEGIEPGGWYRTASGTSASAAAVSGAAALLREVASQGTNMRTIATALRRGARVDTRLIGKVRHGALDVACSARWLADNRHARIDVDALQPGVRHCFAPSTTTYTTEWRFPDEYFDSDALYKGRNTRRQESGADVVSRVLRPFVDDALKAQRQLLPEDSDWPADQIAFFPIEKGGMRRPVAPPNRPMYIFNQPFAELSPFTALSFRCPDRLLLESYDLRWKGSVTPRGYVFATDDVDAFASDDPPTDVMSLSIAAVKPWYVGLLSPLRVGITMRCSLLPESG